MANKTITFDPESGVHHGANFSNIWWHRFFNYFDSQINKNTAF